MKRAIRNIAVFTVTSTIYFIDVSGDASGSYVLIQSVTNLFFFMIILSPLK